MHQTPDSIIFDLDGTLWDSTATVAKAWQAAASKVDYVKEPLPQARIQAVTGLPYDIIYQKLFPYLNDEQLNELKELSGEEELMHVRKFGGTLYEGLEETLRYLREKFRLFIVSNCQSGYIEAFMEYHNLGQYFEDCECYGNAKRSKAANIQDIIRRNKLNAAVYVGDTQGDYDASRESGIPFIYASYGFGKPTGFDQKIDQIKELKALFPQ